MSFSSRTGNRIKKQRERLGLTQKELSNKLSYKIELSEKQISAIERGISGTTIENFVQLCAALKKTPDYFCLGISRGFEAKSDEIDEIVENLQLCSDEDIENIRLISRVFAEKRDGK